jgi:hypothetical protein
MLQALKTVCVRGSLGPFALKMGADVGAVDPAATGAALQAFLGARGGVTPALISRVDEQRGSCGSDWTHYPSFDIHSVRDF